MHIPRSRYAKTPSLCFGNGMLDIHDGTVCDLADYDAFEAGGVDAGAAPGACIGTGDIVGPYECSPTCCTCFQSVSELLYLNPTVGDQWVTLSGRFVAPSALGIARVHTEGQSSAYIRRVQVTKSPDHIMNPSLLPNGEGTFGHQGVTAGTLFKRHKLVSMMIFD